LLDIDVREDGELYTLLTPDGPVECSVFARNLDTFGGAGYHRGGPEMGIEVCLEGPTPVSDNMLGELRNVQKRVFADEIEKIRKIGWNRSTHIQWLHVHDRFEPMGVKMIGAFLDAVRNTDIVDPDLYLAGFQTVPDEIPGIGSILASSRSRCGWPTQWRRASGQAKCLGSISCCPKRLPGSAVSPMPAIV
jgi:hypothetical protein